MKKLALLFLFTGFGLFATEPTFVYLVRHSEKETSTKDPSLSLTGKNRVEMLRYFFSEVPLDGVFATQYKRTQETVGPIARDHKRQVTVIKAQDPKAQIEAIRAHKGKTLLIAGHSNTVPGLIKALGGPEFTLTERDYDDVFLVVLHENGPTFQHFRLRAP